MADGETPILRTGELVLPTDGVPLGRLRQTEPHLFREYIVDAEDSDVIAAVGHELSIAHAAFREAVGLPHPDGYYGRAHNVDVLNDVYARYGISSGMHQTEELVRGIERQAAAQASRWMTKGR